MNRACSILVAVAVAGWLACPPAAISQSATEADQVSQEDRARQQAIEDQQKRVRVEQLARLETEQRLQSELEARHHRDLLGVQVARAQAWATMLRTNWPAYEALRQQAAHSPSHSVPCTFCEVRGQVDFCLVCEGSKKCVNCNGTGQAFGERCTLCRGNGKCFLCFGTGRMPCPFCDAGFVYANGSPPRPAMPVPSGPTDQPAPQPSIAEAQPSSPASGSANASAEGAEPAPQTPLGIEPLHVSRTDLGLAVALFLGGILVVRRLAPMIADRCNARYNPWGPSGSTARRSSNILVDEESFAEFVRAFRIGPTAPAVAALTSEHSIHSGLVGELEDETDPLQIFLASAPKQVKDLRNLLQDIGRVAPEADRQEMLGRLGRNLCQLKGMAGLPELLPAWQMGCALEWLVKQLAEKASRVIPSTLRTVGNGLDLLGELCRPGLRPDLCTNPPIRLLAVDDDAISRHAVSFALKKGIGQPDLAENGPAALALAAKHSYDVIFLDVQMPGMDGYEVCSRIHETEPNRHTPVVFVTMHSDFGARAKSTLCGGNDLIGKPFLTFEITVKALTLALRARLHAADSSAEALAAAPAGLAASTSQPAATSSELCRPSTPTAQPQGLPARTVASRLGPAPDGLLPISAAAAGSEPPSALGTGASISAFLGYASAQIEAVRDLVQRAGQATDGEPRQAILVDLYCRIHSLAAPSRQAELQQAGRVLAALESLLKKLLEHPKNTTPSTFQTMAAALDLLADLCVPGLRGDLASNPPVHLLVVDDDPVARRAIAGGLQLAFGRPESAADGDAAVALATEKPFDAIFMDVQMPGMDGFTACARIHQTTANHDTPVVFVTTHSDEETRREAVQSGGSDFITKPFLCSELTLKALTFILRNRLQKQKPSQEEAPVADAKEACLAAAL